MRLLVCGHREFDDWNLLDTKLSEFALDCYHNKDQLTIIEGGAKGADFLARVWSKKNNVSFVEYPADWKLHGKKAGPIRNRQMITEGKPDLVLAFLHPNSIGTRDMVRAAKDAGIETIVVDLPL